MLMFNFRIQLGLKSRINAKKKMHYQNGNKNKFKLIKAQLRQLASKKHSQLRLCRILEVGSVLVQVKDRYGKHMGHEAKNSDQSKKQLKKKIILIG